MIVSTKFKWAARRILWSFRQLPSRFFRLFSLPFSPFYQWQNGGSVWRSVPFLIADCFFIFDVYEILSAFYKSKTRPLTDDEILRGSKIFKQKIDYQLVMIDETAEIGCKKMQIIYVSFNTINSWGAMTDDILIHELVHVWQYQHFGAGYIACALKAQASKAGYNYAHTEGWLEKQHFLDFNAEQQGDIVQDFFLIQNNQKPKWLAGDNTQKVHLQKLVEFFSR